MGNILLLNQWQTDELVGLFRQVLAKLAKPSIKMIFKLRLANIANAELPTNPYHINIPCLYLQASHDNLVKSHNSKKFNQYFTHFKIEKTDGTQVLWQTNPVACWTTIKKFTQKSKIT